MAAASPILATPAPAVNPDKWAGWRQHVTTCAACGDRYDTRKPHNAATCAFMAGRKAAAPARTPWREEI